MTDTITESPTQVAVTLEVKIGLPDYSNVVARAYCQQNVKRNDESFALARAASFAREAVDGALSEFGGIDAVIPQITASRRSRGVETPIPVEEAAALVADAFPGATEDDGWTPSAPAPAKGGEGLQVAGKQHGPLPAWLFEACAEAGVTKVYDNRDTANAENRRPWFKSTTGGRDAQAFWPPKGSKG